VPFPKSVRAAPRDADGGPARKGMLGGLPLSHTSIHEPKQDAPSAEAIAAARDLAFDAIVETASLSESYSRSLAEAGWRGDRATVEVHLKQLRSCVLAAIDAFKALDAAEAGRAAA
jgi:hypothetical protein